MAPTTIDSGGVTLAVDDAGEGTPVVLLHGLTATRRYVVMGSKSLERSGHRVVAYDARGHGESAPAPLPGRLRLRRPRRRPRGGARRARHRARGPRRRVDGRAHDRPRWRSRAPRPRRGGRVHHPGVRARTRRGPRRLGPPRRGPAQGGIEGFVQAYDLTRIPETWHDTVLRVIRQRLAAARAPRRGRRRPAGRAALPAVRVARRPRAHRRARRSSSPAATRPTPVIPSASASAAPRRSPTRGCATEEPGKSPLAWQGGQLSKLIADLAGSVRPAA